MPIISVPMHDDSRNTDTDTSLSFLDSPFSHKSVHRAPTSSLDTPENTSRSAVMPNAVDSALLPYLVEVPRKIEQFFKGADSVQFIYRYTACDYIGLVDIDTGDVVYRVYVADYESFAFPEELSSRLIFIHGKECFKQRARAREQRAYSSSVANGKAYAGSSEYKDRRRAIVEYQVATGRNIEFIEEPEDLHRAIRNLAALLGKQQTYVPKARACSTREELYLVLLHSIPGISERAALAIQAAYPTLQVLREALINNYTAVSALAITDGTGENSRLLGNKLAGKLKTAFLSAERYEKVNNN